MEGPIHSSEMTSALEGKKKLTPKRKNTVEAGVIKELQLSEEITRQYHLRGKYLLVEKAGNPSQYPSVAAGACYIDLSVTSNQPEIFGLVPEYGGYEDPSFLKKMALAVSHIFDSEDTEVTPRKKTSNILALDDTYKKGEIVFIPFPPPSVHKPDNLPASSIN